MPRSHLLLFLLVAAVAAAGGWLFGRAASNDRIGALESETGRLRDRVRQLDAELEIARREPAPPSLLRPDAATELPSAPAAGPLEPAAAPEAAPTLDAEHRLRRIAEIEAAADGYFEDGKGGEALAALKELASLVPEGREAAMALAVRINEDVNGPGKLGLSSMVFYTSLGDPSVRDLMTWSLENPSTPAFRAMSAYSLPWTLPPEETLARFSKALDREKDADVQRALVWNLAQMKNPEAEGALLDMLRDPAHAASVRAFVATEIAEGANPAIEEALRNLALSETDPQVRRAAETALRIRKPPATGFLVTGTVPGSQASVAGVAAGDILVSYDGRRIETLDELRTAAQDAGGRDEVEIVVVRGNERVTLRLRPGKMGVYGREVEAATDR